MSSIDKYYQSRKIQATTARATTTITTPTTAASTQHKDKNRLSTSDSTEELIESLSQITGRRKRTDLEESLARLQKADLNGYMNYVITIADYKNIVT